MITNFRDKSEDLAETVKDTEFGYYFDDDYIIKYYEDSGNVSGFAFLFDYDYQTYGLFTVFVHIYTDNNTGEEVREVKQIYNISDYYLYDAEMSILSE